MNKFEFFINLLLSIGQFAKYSYKLTIGVQKLNGTTQLLRLPFRVYSLLDFEKFIPISEMAFPNGVYQREPDSISSFVKVDLNSVESSEKDKQEENPFEVVEKSEYENLEYALEILEDLTARVSTSSSIQSSFSIIIIIVKN